ncbi:invasion associated locus B family protein [Faunimonas sp. B44]|uniref:invasion associated locus B family protein n=1 Tax=Faunimonas sp. B44 TaxID=3461493 RepID=UPI004043F673
MNHRILLTLAAGLLTTSAAFAQTPTSIGKFNDWSAWTYAGSKGKVCYIHSTPKTMRPQNLNHGDISFFIRRSPAEGIQSEANFVAGYPFRESSTATVDIDGQKFTLFTQGDSAWLLNASDEAKLLAAMKAGRSMTVTATSGRGNETSYSYSLSGVTAASDKIVAECR